MLDIKFVRENPDEVKASEKRRGHDENVVNEVLRLDEAWRGALKPAEALKKQRNVVSEQINKAKKAKDEATAKAKIAEMKKAIVELKAADEKAQDLLQQRNNALKTIGNILDASVPSGKDDSENVELKRVGEIRKFDFKIKDHIEIGLELDLIDLDTAAANSGARFYYLKNEAVLLSFALQRYAMDRLRAVGFTLIKTPFMLNRGALEGGVNMSDFEDTIYKIEDEDLYLIATSEHPLVALRRNSVIDEKDLPLKFCGVSSCFRRELGSHGRDDKGIFRVHEFNKVEEIVYCTPENSMKYFEELQALSEKLFEDLGIAFRVVQICTGDIGNKQSLQYDIEAWFPAQNDGKGRYREVTSCSNCLDYQSVSLNTKFVDAKGERGYVHLLNNTALTDTRPIAAILENFQQKDGSVKIPKVLVPYMGGIEVIERK